MAKTKTIFFEPKSKVRAKIVDITSPTAFKRSIRTFKKSGLTLAEKRSLALGKARASAQLKRKDLSKKERKQMKAITKIKLPKLSR